METDKFILQKKGGKWLGACRSWIQWNCNNGSNVTWGSRDVLITTHGNINVKDLEDVASEVAAVMINKYSNKIQSLTTENAELKEKVQKLEDKIYETIGWVIADACISLDSGEDYRKLKVPSILERAKNDLKFDELLTNKKECGE